MNGKYIINCGNPLFSHLDALFKERKAKSVVEHVVFRVLKCEPLHDDDDDDDAESMHP